MQGHGISFNDIGYIIVACDNVLIIDSIFDRTHKLNIGTEGTDVFFQVKRFTNDVLRILKSQACKQISLSEFPSTYSKIFGRNFDITDYGMCNMLDALSELPEG